MSFRTREKAVSFWEVLDVDERPLVTLSFEPGAGREPTIGLTTLYDDDNNADLPDLCLSIQDAEQLHEALGAAIASAKSHRK